MSGEMVPPQYSPSDTTSARSPLAVVQSALVEERGHSTRALSYLAQARLGEMDTCHIRVCKEPIGLTQPLSIGRARYRHRRAEPEESGTEWDIKALIVYYFL